jgi:hypothetical protein
MTRLSGENTLIHASNSTTSASYRHAYDIFCAHISDIEMRTQFAQTIAGRMNIANTHVSVGVFVCFQFVYVFYTYRLTRL